VADSARFPRAVDNTRPYKSHLYHVFGPKINRSLSLYHLRHIDTWLLLESDPAVISYCERPLVIPDAKPKRVVDFWVGFEDRDELWLVSPEDEPDIPAPSAGLVKWADANRCLVRSIKPPEESARVYLDNWGMIVRDLSSNRRYLTPALINAVRSTLEHARPILALCQLLHDHDPVLVRSALYHLMHTGTAICTDIASRPIGPASIVVRV
jgi:hypothetical protein